MVRRENQKVKESVKEDLAKDHLKAIMKKGKDNQQDRTDLVIVAEVIEVNRNYHRAVDKIMTNSRKVTKFKFLNYLRTIVARDGPNHKYNKNE